MTLSSQQKRQWKRQFALGIATNYTDFDVADVNIADELSMLSKHEHVKKITLSPEHHIIVTTKKLYPWDVITDEKIRRNIGSYTITIRYGKDYAIATGISVVNNTYVCWNLDHDQQYFHPHIARGDSDDDASICLGDNKTTVNACYAWGTIYALVDFLITFLTSWNSGNPFIDYDYFLNHKKRRTSKDVLLNTPHSHSHDLVSYIQTNDISLPFTSMGGGRNQELVDRQQMQYGQRQQQWFLNAITNHT